MSTFAVLAAISVAFPRPGQTLPPVDATYMCGAVPRGTTNLVVQGKPVDVYKTGAWVTMVDVAEGENAVEISANGESTNVTVRVERKPKPVLDADGNPVKPPEKVYEKLEYTKDVPRPHPCGKEPKDVTIVVDPGHGGPKDMGAVSPHGFFEKDANLLLAREVRQALTNLGYNVIMTRDDDRALVLGERPRVACETGADAFVSIHHNATVCNKDPRTVRYTAVYKWNPLGERLAAAINARMGAALEGDIPNNGVMHANFAVTRNPEVPSCLVETDFIATPEGEEAIWDYRRRRRIAESIAAGIDDWRASSAE
jgi:N-acetylmuramoyl-L-alanine amidase